MTEECRKHIRLSNPAMKNIPAKKNLTKFINCLKLAPSIKNGAMTPECLSRMAAWYMRGDADESK